MKNQARKRAETTSLSGRIGEMPAWLRHRGSWGDRGLPPSRDRETWNMPKRVFLDFLHVRKPLRDRNQRSSPRPGLSSYSPNSWTDQTLRVPVTRRLRFADEAFPDFRV